MPGTPPLDARAALLTVAHELSNALAVALGRLQLAERHGGTDRARSGKDLSACAVAIRRAAALLEDLTHRVSLSVAPAPQSESEQRRGQRRHVLVIDSAPGFLDLMRELLQRERYNVTTTNFVPRSFAQIAALQPDLLVVDLVVCQHAGWDLLEHLASEAATQGIPVVVTSTDTRLLEKAKRNHARYGRHHYLVRPFDLDDLVVTIHGVIGSA
jgi:CheY-like chemotaxis protein